MNFNILESHRERLDGVGCLLGNKHRDVVSARAHESLYRPLQHRAAQDINTLQWFCGKLLRTCLRGAAGNCFEFRPNDYDGSYPHRSLPLSLRTTLIYSLTLITKLTAIQRDLLWAAAVHDAWEKADPASSSSLCAIATSNCQPSNPTSLRFRGAGNPRLREERRSSGIPRAVPASPGAEQCGRLR